jgi:hypothetical protein
MLRLDDLESRGVIEQVIRHGRIDRARTNGVDADTIRGLCRRHGLRQGNDAALSRMNKARVPIK